MTARLHVRQEIYPTSDVEESLTLVNRAQVQTSSWVLLLDIRNLVFESLSPADVVRRL